MIDISELFSSDELDKIRYNFISQLQFDFCFENEGNNVDFIINVVEDFSHLGGLLLDYVIDKIKVCTLSFKDFYKKYKVWNSTKNYLIRF